MLMNIPVVDLLLWLHQTEVLAVAVGGKLAQISSLPMEMCPQLLADRWLQRVLQHLCQDVLGTWIKCEQASSS